MVTSLTDRIRSINRMNNTHKDEEIEEKMEQSLVETVEEVEQSWEKAKEEEKKEVKTGVTLDMLYLEVQALTETIAQQTEEIKKINKHINATQKMLKKSINNG